MAMNTGKQRFRAHLLLAILLVALSTGCMSVEEGRQQFEDEMNQLMGRSVTLVRGEPLARQRLTERTTEIVYGYTGGCKWAVVIDDATEILQSWKYVSDPSRCYYRTNWFGPW
jgi:hypothetical protein